MTSNRLLVLLTVMAAFALLALAAACGDDDSEIDLGDGTGGLPEGTVAGATQTPCPDEGMDDAEETAPAGAPGGVAVECPDDMEDEEENADSGDDSDGGALETPELEGEDSR